MPGGQQEEAQAGGDAPPQQQQAFLTQTPENAHLNQYWFSPATVQVFIAEIEAQLASSGGDEDGESLIGFLSTPSLYFSLDPTSKTRRRARLLDFDNQWDTEPGFVHYDYKHPEAIPKELHHKFSMIIIDPPYITSCVWTKYIEAARLLMQEGDGEEGSGSAKILCTTVHENAGLLKELLGVEERKFMPSIPHLVYQFSTFSNFARPCRLDKRNPELGVVEEEEEEEEEEEQQTSVSVALEAEAALP